MLRFAIICVLASTAFARVGFLKSAPAVDSALIERELMAELVGKKTTLDRQLHVARMEELLRPMYVALAKDEDGHIGHAAVRYVLHRLFMQQYSWYFRGLEPGASVGRSSESLHTNFSLESLPVWPAFLQHDVEKVRGGSGLSLSDVSSLAATLEDLAHHDTVDRLSMAYDAADVSVTDSLDQHQLDSVMEKYGVLFLSAWNLPNFTHESVHKAEDRYQRQRRWRETIVPWLVDVEANVLASRDAEEVSVSDVVHMADSVGKNFSQIFNSECKDMKHMLLTREDRKQGRIRLSDFYNMSRVSNWAFTEKIEYLRTLGALDESNVSNPLVIVPNYVASMPQCMKASSLYLVCCPNECESLMIHLETEIAAPDASPDTILRVVAGLSSDSVAAPRELPVALQARLQDVAAHHGGRVPLHGRLMAQWMHHAYPRECPFPHETGTTSPVTADEWIKESGQGDSQASDAEMSQHIRPDDTCPADASDGCGDVDLPWNPVEELLHQPFGSKSSIAGEREALSEVDFGLVEGEVEVARLLKGIDSEGDAVATAAARPHGLPDNINVPSPVAVIGSTMTVLGFIVAIGVLLRAYSPASLVRRKTGSTVGHVSVSGWV